MAVNTAVLKEIVQAQNLLKHKNTKNNFISNIKKNLLQHENVAMMII